MRIALAIHSLAGRGGTETYTLTLADHLQRLGHDVWVIAAESGRGAELAGELGVRVVASAQELAEAPEAIVSQDAAAAYEAAAALPGIPQLFVAHSDIFDLQLPPQLPGITGAVVVMHDRTERRVRALALELPLVRLTQPIDVQAFAPARALPPRPRVALAMGNYVHGERALMIARACERAGIELRHVGVHGGGETASPAETYNAADIVFGKARVIYEAMACGRAAYVLDHNGAEGWVTSENRARLAADNFGGQSEPIELDEDLLAADLERYDAASGPANRDFVVAHNSAAEHAAAIVEALRELTPGTPPQAPLTEIARLVRAYHRVDAQVMVLRAELERTYALAAESGARAQEAEQRAQQERARAEAERTQAAAELARAGAAADQARGEVTRRAILAAGDRQSAQAASGRLAEVQGSLRWRAAQAALRPLDVARRRRAPVAVAPAPPAAPPQLAIGPETGFGLVVDQTAGPVELAIAIQSLDTWPELGLELDDLAELLASVRPWSAGEGLRAIYRAYAARHGKPRWGDETPLHVSDARLRPSDLAPGLLVGDGVQIGREASIGANVVVHAGTVVGAGVSIGDWAILGRVPTLAATSRGVAASPRPLVVEDGATVGARAILYAGARIAASAAVGDGTQLRELAEVGERSAIGDGAALGTGAVVGCDVIVGRGAWLTSWTRVDDGARVGAGVCTMNDDTMARLGESGLRGPVLGRGCVVDAAVLVTPGVTVGEGAVVEAGATVSRDVEPGACVAGVPARVVARTAG